MADIILDIICSFKKEDGDFGGRIYYFLWNIHE